MLVWRGIHDKILHQHQNIYVNKLYVYIDLRFCYLIYTAQIDPIG